ncbi:CG15435 [Drosophila busckii]|uniref:CG15435 n=1 Tax=Drosophila busckii TaxID=30019 RepID=A0A0M4EXD2_DROBS|nr:CG15435 [Drosophila busckii]
MTTCGNICRVCSSPAKYNIFEKIPEYLHGSTNEFLNYEKPINILLEETTGLNNSPADGLPLHICALCISYLKHAVTFREQCIKNALNLKLVAADQQRLNSRISIKSVSNKERADQLRDVQRPVDNLLLNNLSAHPEATEKVQKKLLSQVAPQSGKKRFGELFHNETQDKMELPASSGGTGAAKDEDSSDDKEVNNYSGINCGVDDSMEQDQLRDINVNLQHAPNAICTRTYIKIISTTVWNINSFAL